MVFVSRTWINIEIPQNLSLGIWYLNMKKIVLTGGGTAGHVTPNMALIPELQKQGYEVHYIGSYDGIEKKLIADLGIPYYSISSGKLRRYIDLKNISDPFKVIKGLHQARRLLKKIKPDVVFSKGGFVSVPVVVGAKSRKIPCVIHESDMTPGLANKICIPCATRVCTNFPETIKHLPAEKAVLTGSPIREELFHGNKAKGLSFCGFDDSKPVILIIGGSLGAVAVNNAVRKILPKLLKKYQVIHLCGKDKLDTTLEGTNGYVQFEYIKDELCDLMAAADIMISRAGANAICEILALRKPNILIPLSAQASRGDQILNAASFEKAGYSIVIQEEDITDENLLAAVNQAYENREDYVKAMKRSQLNNSIEKIVGLINEAAKHKKK